MKKFCGMRLTAAAVVLGSLYMLIFLYASIHTSYNLMSRLQQEHVHYRKWYMDTDSVLFHSFCVCLSVTTFISSILLIFGAVKKNHKLMLPWLIDGIIFLICLIVYLALFINMCTVYILNNGLVDIQVILVLIRNILLVVLQIIFWRVIQQHYKNIVDNKERQSILPTTVPLYPQNEELY